MSTHRPPGRWGWCRWGSSPCRGCWLWSPGTPPRSQSSDSPHDASAAVRASWIIEEVNCISASLFSCTSDLVATVRQRPVSSLSCTRYCLMGIMEASLTGSTWHLYCSSSVGHVQLPTQIHFITFCSNNIVKKDEGKIFLESRKNLPRSWMVNKTIIGYVTLYPQPRQPTWCHTGCRHICTPASLAWRVGSSTLRSRWGRGASPDPDQQTGILFNQIKYTSHTDLFWYRVVNCDKNDPWWCN